VNRKEHLIIVILFTIILFINYITYRGIENKAMPSVVLNNGKFKTLNTLDLSIGLFYDANYSEPWNFNGLQLTSDLNQMLVAYNLTVSILNATELRVFMEENPLGIVIITMGLAPDTIWNGSEHSFVETWLDNGGIMLWTGCYEFYWVGYSSGQNVPVGEVGAQYVLDMDYVLTTSDLQVEPTSLGETLFLNISTHTTDIFSSVSVLTNENVYFEVYARNGDYADPILFQPKDGRGYFIRIHANWNDALSITNLSSWISSFIYNRFFKLSYVVATSQIEAIYFLSSEPLLINLTNFSDTYSNLLFNSTGDAFESINTQYIMEPNVTKCFMFSITPLSSARFQIYEFHLNIYSNFTSTQNNSITVQIYSKKFLISIQSPVCIELLPPSGILFPGGTYTLTLNYTNNINESILADVTLICEGCMNQIKSQIILDEDIGQIQIQFTIKLTTRSGLFDFYLRISQNGVIFSSTEVTLKIESIFRNPLVILGLIIISSVCILMIGLLFFNRKKRKASSILAKKRIKNELKLNG